MTAVLKTLWYNADPMPPADTVARATKYFRQHRYAGELGSGFIVSRATQEEVQAEFVVRSIIEDTFEDPITGPVTVKRHAISVTPFLLSSAAPHLEVESAGRNVRNLINELSNNVLPECAFERAIFNFDALLVVLRKHIGKIDVTGIETAPFYLNGRTIVQAQFKSLYDVSDDAARLLGMRDYSIAGVRAAPKEIPDMRLEITKLGRLVVTSGSGGEVLERVRQGVREYLSRRR